MAPTSPLAVTIPGAIDAWCHLHATYGLLPLERIFQPAIDAARKRFPGLRRASPMMGAFSRAS